MNADSLLSWVRGWLNARLSHRHICVHRRPSAAKFPFFWITQPKPNAARQGPGSVHPHAAAKPGPTVPIKPSRIDPLNREPATKTGATAPRATGSYFSSATATAPPARDSAANPRYGPLPSPRPRTDQPAMRLSHSFVPTLKETPAEAQIASHRLMLRAGLVRQTSAGIYAWLPAGFRVLKNIERIVREEQDAAGAQEILMPTIQPAELWRESGRYDGYGKEMLRILDRHDREMLYGPTNEEMVTDLFRQSVKSYRELPQILYHIQWKFRDEVRPRFGVMRGREFLMKDAYSFDMDHAGAVASYRKMMLAYMRTFQRMGLKAIPMEAESGPIGGDLSHEFIILAPTGESQVYYDADFEEIDYVNAKFDYNATDLDAFFKHMTSLDAATDEKHDASKWAQVDPARRREGRGIEVGHIFYFGTKYSRAMNATVAAPDGKPVHPEMG